MLEILTRITEGKGQPDDVALLEELGALIRDGALCGLGTVSYTHLLSSQFFLAFTSWGCSVSTLLIITPATCC